MIYLPIELNDNYCVVYQDSNILRVYDNSTIDNNNIDYTDFLINSHYNYFTGKSHIDSFECIDNSRFTTNWTYRNDLSDLLICLFFFVIFFFGTPLFLFSRLFKKKF